MQVACEFRGHTPHRPAGVVRWCDENLYIVSPPALKRPICAALPPKQVLATVGQTARPEDLSVVRVLESLHPERPEIWLAVHGEVASCWVRVSGSGGQTAYWTGRLVPTNGEKLWEFSQPRFIENGGLLRATDRRRRACSIERHLIEVRGALDDALSLARSLRNVERAGPSAMKRLREGAMGEGARTRRGRPSRIDAARLRELEASGAADGRIAAEFGVSRRTVARWRKDHVVPRSRPPDSTARG